MHGTGYVFKVYMSAFILWIFFAKSFFSQLFNDVMVFIYWINFNLLVHSYIDKHLA